MKAIQLTKGFVAIVDDEDFEALAQYNWCYSGHKDGGYAVRRKKLPDGSAKKVYMHREIAGNFAEGKCVDHRNGNKLDNRRENLRACTHAQNSYNYGKKPSNKSGFKGVHWHSQRKKWTAQISVDKKIRHLGLFNTPEEAAMAYNAAAIRLHGDFANIN